MTEFRIVQAIDGRAVLNFTVAINAALIWKNTMVEGVATRPRPVV
jgi:hypothetical protein